MYVDVIACKRERIKVDVTLAKRSASRAVPTVVSLAVRKAAASELDPADEVEIIEVVDEIVDEPADEIVDDISDADDEAEALLPEVSEVSGCELCDECEQEMESVMELLSLAGDQPDSELTAAVSEFFDSESTPDEDLTAIDELLAGADDEISEDSFDDIVADALGELDNMNRRADDMRERLDGELAQALEEITGSAEEESEELTSVIGKELESLDSVLGQRNEAASASPAGTADSEIPHSAESSAYMRYFDRDTHGGRVEVSRDVATGQEVICYDETSGRLSRVCGIIKKDGTDTN